MLKANAATPRRKEKFCRMASKCTFVVLLMIVSAYAQEPQSPAGGMPSMPGMPGMAGMPGMNMEGATNDLFIMAGSDFDRPGLVPRANYSIGIGHMFKFLKKDPFGDELTFSYMYENSG